jgi:hypothetical protein
VHLTPSFKRSFVIAAVLGGVLSGIACSGSTATGNAGGGGAYCSHLADFAQACGQNDPCAQAEAQACPSIAGNVSAALAAAVAACVDPPFACPDAGNWNTQPLDCIAGQINAATPTSAQAQVKADFCKVCPDGASTVDSRSCSNFFSYPGFAQTAGAGHLVSVVSDAVAAQMDQRCISASGDCALGFSACTEIIFAMSTNNPSACNAGGSVTGLFAHPRIR